MSKFKMMELLGLRLMEPHLIRVNWETLHHINCSSALTDPSQSGQSFDGKGTPKFMLEGRCTISARLSAMASAIHSAVAFSPLQDKKNSGIILNDLKVLNKW